MLRRQYRLRLTSAAVHSSRGDWDQAIAELRAMVQVPGTPGSWCPWHEACSARLLARRGEPGAAGEILSVALDEVANVEDSFVSGPLAVAQVELGWLDGSLGAMTDDARRALDLAAATGHRSVQAEMSAYLGRAGIEVPSPADPPGPWAPTLAGRWEEAAAAWAALGERYEEAVVLATAPHGQTNACGLRILRELKAAATLMAV